MLFMKRKLKVQTESKIKEKQKESDVEYINVVFLAFADKKTVFDKKEDYPRYITEYDLCIDNPISKHRQLIKEGYLTEADIHTRLNALSVADLCSIAEKIDLIITKKKKQDIICQLASNIDLSLFDIPQIYILSDIGIKYIQERKDLLEVHKHFVKYNISISDYREEYKKTTYHRKYNDIVWAILQNRYMEASIKKNYSAVRNVYLIRYYVLDEENKQIDALYTILKVFYFDLSVLLFPNSSDPVMVAPAIIDFIRKYGSVLNSDIMDRVFENAEIPFTYITRIVFEQIVNDIISGTFTDINNYK